MFFSGNRQQSNARAGQKKNMFFFGNAQPKSNARAHLKQRKKHSGLSVKQNRWSYLKYRPDMRGDSASDCLISEACRQSQTSVCARMMIAGFPCCSLDGTTTLHLGLPICLTQPVPSTYIHCRSHVDSMLGQCLRRWPDIKSASGQWIGVAESATFSYCDVFQFRIKIYIQ